MPNIVAAIHEDIAMAIHKAPLPRRMAKGQCLESLDVSMTRVAVDLRVGLRSVSALTYRTFGALRII